MKRPGPHGARRRPRVALVGFACATIAACGVGDGPTEPRDGPEPFLSVAPETIDLDAIGATVRARVQVLDGTGGALRSPSAVWSSSDPSIVSVGPDGLITAGAPGNAQIAVTVDSLVAYVPAAVVQVPSSMEFEPGVATLSGAGDTLQVVAFVRDRLGTAIAGAPLAWSSADTAVARVDGRGRVTAVSPGTTRVMVASGPMIAGFPVTVTVLPGSLTVDADTLRFASLGDTKTLSATVRDTRGDEMEPTAVQWRSLDSSVAEVSAGSVRAMGNGVTWVEASLGTILDSVRVVVDQAPAAISLAPASITLNGPEDTFRATAAVLDAGGSTIERASIAWTAGNSAVASVDEEGLVTGVAVGETWIEATHDGFSGSLAVVVTAPVEAPSFATEINPLFRSNGCLSCHGGGGSGGLALSRDAATSYANLVEVPSQGAPAYLRVQPYDSFDSYLIMKLEGRQLSGGRMPLGQEALSEAKISKVRRWIDGGAPNNQ